MLGKPVLSCQGFPTFQALLPLQQLPPAAIARTLIRRSTALAEAALTNNPDEHSEISARRIKWRAAARGAD